MTYERPFNPSAFSLSKYNELFARGDIAGKYTIPKSTQFTVGSAQYYSRTNEVASNQQKFTISLWAKRNTINGSGTAYWLINGSSSQGGGIGFSGTAWGTAADRLVCVFSGTTVFETNALYRDPAAWYHIVLAVDTTQLVASERVILYVNGNRVTSFASTSYPSINATLNWNAADTISIGRAYTTNYYYDGNIADVYHVDGQQLNALTFGKLGIYNNWIPVKPKINYFGINGFYMQMADKTTDTFGLDLAPLGNHFWNNALVTDSTAYNYSLSNDSPTDNYASVSGLDQNGYATSLAGGTQYSLSGASGGGEFIGSLVSLPASGKYYWEFNLLSTGAASAIGLKLTQLAGRSTTGSVGSGGVANEIGYNTNGDKQINGTGSAYGATWNNTASVISVLADVDGGNVTFWKNGVSQGTIAYGAIAGFKPTFSGTSAQSANINFGQRPFIFPIPAGYLPLSTANLPNPTVQKASSYFNAIDYTGNGGYLIEADQTKVLAATGYNIGYSLRFRLAATASISRTFGAPTNNNKWTTSAWVKRTVVGADTAIFGSWVTGGLSTQCYFNSSDQLRFFQTDASGVTKIDYVTNRRFRNTAEWMHVVIAYDNTLVTTSVNIYINGVLETSFATSTLSPTQNGNYSWNKNTVVSYIGVTPNTSGTLFGYWDGCVSEIIHVDGQQLTPSSFGVLNSDSVWAPIQFIGTYGAAGFFLNFSNATSATTMCNDSSGNTNHWTASNISVTTGLANAPSWDQMTDTPTNNIAVLDALNNTGITLSNGGLSWTGGTYQKVVATLGISAPTYIEIQMPSIGVGTSVYLGIGNYPRGVDYPTGGSNYFSNGPNEWGFGVSNNISYIANNSNQVTGPSSAANDIWMIAVNPYTGKIWFGKNGVWFKPGTGSASADINPALDTYPYYSNMPINQKYLINSTGRYYFACDAFSSPSAASVNFGQRPYQYTAPTGFNTLNANAAKNDYPVLGLNTADLIWIKSRSAATSNNWFDTTRGLNIGLVSDTTALEYTDPNTFISNNNYGLNVGPDTSTRGINTLNATYSAWVWKKGTTPGFNIVTYTGTGSSGNTFSHGLGVAPEFFIIKTRTTTTSLALAYHANMNATPQNGYLVMDTSAFTSGASAWNNTAPSNTVVTLGNGSSVNAASTTYIAYLWASIPGFSKISSYTGNGSADGPYVHTGFRPKFLLIKGVSSTGSWYMIDSSRSLYNPTAVATLAEQGIAESSVVAPNIDFLSNGFKLRSTTTDANANGNVFTYMAFAEIPFKYATAR